MGTELALLVGMLVQMATERRRGAAAATRIIVAGVAAAGLAVLITGRLALAHGSEAADKAPRVFEIVASRYAFDPPRIEVAQGDRVKLVLRSADTAHGLAIDAYGVKVAIPKGGEEVSVEFMAHRPGTFRMTCSEYCGSGHKRMQGRLVVTEEGK